MHLLRFLFGERCPLVGGRVCAGIEKGVCDAEMRIVGGGGEKRVFRRWHAVGASGRHASGCLSGMDNIADDAEITVEVNPDDVDTLYAESLRAVGINRVSIGVQSFSDSNWLSSIAATMRNKPFMPWTCCEKPDLKTLALI